MPKLIDFEDVRIRQAERWYKFWKGNKERGDYDDLPIPPNGLKSNGMIYDRTPTVEEIQPFFDWDKDRSTDL